MRILITVLLALVLFSCKEDNHAEPQIENDMFSAKRNGIRWSGDISILHIIETDSLIISGTSNRPNDEVITIKIKYEGLGKYKLLKTRVVYYTTIGGDVLKSRYKLTSNYSGTLVLSKYDDKEKVLEGSFELILEKEVSYSESGPNILFITEGNFRGGIKEW